MIIMERSGATVQKSVSSNICAPQTYSARGPAHFEVGVRIFFFSPFDSTLGDDSHMSDIFPPKPSSSLLRLTREQSALNYISVKLSTRKFTIKNKGLTENV